MKQSSGITHKHGSSSPSSSTYTSKLMVECCWSVTLLNHALSCSLSHAHSMGYDLVPYFTGFPYQIIIVTA